MPFAPVVPTRVAYTTPFRRRVIETDALARGDPPRVIRTVTTRFLSFCLPPLVEYVTESTTGSACGATTTWNACVAVCVPSATWSVKS